VITTTGERHQQRRLPDRTDDAWTTHVRQRYTLPVARRERTKYIFPNSPEGFELVIALTREHPGA